MHHATLPTLFFSWIFAVSLAMSTSARTFSGAALLAVLVWIFTLSIFKNLIQQETTSDFNHHSTLHKASFVLMSFFLAAFLLKSTASLYWKESILSNNFELRILLASIAIVLLIKLKIKSALSPSIIMGAIIISIIFAFPHILIYATKGIMTPYHVISWMGGIVFFCILTLIGTSNKSPSFRIFSYAGLAIGCISIYLSGVRAAYPIPILILLFITIQNRSLIRQKIIWIATFSLGAATIFFAFNGVHIISNRISAGITDIDQIIVNQNSPENYAKSSLGARLYMWQRSIETGISSPMVGIGKTDARNIVKKWGEEIGSETVARQRHVHNDYVQSFLDHGFIGLTSWVLIIAGIAISGLIYSKFNLGLGLVLILISISHAFMTFFNTNSAHNNYPTFLALSLIIFFKIASSFPIQQETKIDSN